MAPNITEASLFSPPLCEDPARRLPCTTTKGTTAGLATLAPCSLPLVAFRTERKKNDA